MRTAVLMKQYYKIRSRLVVVRRIVAKAVLYVIRDDTQAAPGPRQLCVGQIAGKEAAFHAVRSVFNHNDSVSHRKSRSFLH